MPLLRLPEWASARLRASAPPSQTSFPAMSSLVIERFRSSAWERWRAETSDKPWPERSSVVTLVSWVSASAMQATPRSVRIAVVRAAPFFAELIADEGLHERYVRAVRSRLEEVESEIGGFERVDAEDALEGGWGVVEAAKKSGADVGGDVMAIPAVAYFGHATAPWNVLGTKR